MCLRTRTSGKFPARILTILDARSAHPRETVRFLERKRERERERESERERERNECMYAE